jgi:hypothetical protein
MQTPTDQPASPPAQLEHHPAAALFPLLPIDSPEFGELVADIGEHGLLQPIVLHEGKILDGRNRYRACQHAGVEPRFVEWRGESPTAYDMRVEAGLQMLENRQLREVRVTHPGTGELVLVTREEILKHADDDRRVLEAALRYEEARGQLRVVTGGR